MVNIMGAAYASVSASDRPLLKAHSDLSKAREDAAENVEEQEARFTLSLLISEMDKQLLLSSHQTIAKYVLVQLQQFSGILYWVYLGVRTCDMFFFLLLYLMLSVHVAVPYHEGRTACWSKVGNLPLIIIYYLQT